jgi:RNA-directed DNA polymerase
VQTAAKLILEPIWEADLEPNAYGYRPGRSAQDAVEKVQELLNAGYGDVVDADLSKYLDRVSYCPRVAEKIGLLFHHFDSQAFTSPLSN